MKPIRLALLTIAAVVIAAPIAVFPILTSTARIGRQEKGFYLLPTNQLLQPWGEQSVIKGRPVDAAFDSQKRVLAVLNTRGVELFTASNGTPIGTIKSGSTSYTGLAYRPGDRELWNSETTRNGPDGILVTDISETGLPMESHRIPLNEHPVPAGIAFTGDGNTAYVAMSRRNTLGVFDASGRKMTKEVPVGIAPFGVVVGAKRGKIYVSNRGGRRPIAGDTTAPTSGSQAVTDPVTGSSTTGTVSAIDQETLEVHDIPVGLAPSGMALNPDESLLAVANGHSDTVSMIDTQTMRRADVKIPAWPEGVIGSQPIGVAFSPEGGRLYVACGGTNSITVLTGSGTNWSIAGAVPTGWFPSSIAVDAEGALRIVNIKGVGNTADGKGTFRSTAFEGSLVRLPAPVPAQLAAGMREVEAANSPRLDSAGGVQHLASLGIQHVFFIVKENRTYDQVFGDLAEANGDPKLVMFGRDTTPNHHALAEKYVILDNFYTGGAISFDGHQWLMQSFVSDYTERAFAASPRGYAWNMSDSLTVSPAGFFWQPWGPAGGAGARSPSIRIYGEFGLPARWNPATRSAIDMNEADLLSWTEYWNLYKAGKWQTAVGERSGVPALANLLDPRYPNNNTSIPDQIRASEFLRELAECEKTGTMPQLSVITLNNDHTNGTRPGSPTPRAMVADNDLALGRIVEGLSKSRFWPSSLVLVVEDDAQNGVDHVDGHRTVALAIGPSIRRGAVDSNHYNHSSMVRTIQDIFKIAPQTRFVANARPMTSVFTTTRNADVYQALTPKVALDEMNPALNALRGRRRWAARQSAAMNWSEPDDVPEDVLNRILWWDSKGYDAEYPVVARRR
ncbi:MAG: hypothetical protein M3Y07_04080 [Acidobacteriota bacterium]|nr:hypothetical protein [Acidobacteriota bacterium]